MQDFAAHSIGHIAPQTILYEGRYRIDLLLAEAPTRAIYRAWDLAQQRPATILELATPDAATAAAALQHAAPLVQLNHDALTPIQVIFVEKGTFFLALALAGGQTIERIMAERANPITAAAAVRWIAQAAEGVEFLDQEMPTWHLGDLSPAALLVTAEDRVQLLGFEVALGLMTPPALAATLPAGAVAPELATGQCDAQSDVYGLAATLYFLLTRQQWSARRESLALLRPELSRALVATVMRGLATDPAARWPDAATFYQELLRTLPVNYPTQNGAPWWDDEHPPHDDLAEEPPTIVMTRDQLRGAVAAQQAALGIASAAEPITVAAPSDTYIVVSPEKSAEEPPAPVAATDDLSAEDAPTAPTLEDAAVAATATAAAFAALSPEDSPVVATLSAAEPSTLPVEDAAVLAPTASAPLPDAADTTASADDTTPAPSEQALGTEAASSTWRATPTAIMPDDVASPERDAMMDGDPPEVAAPGATTPDDDLVMPEPVAPTILRPRWAWSDEPAAPATDVSPVDAPATDVIAPAMADEASAATLDVAAPTASDGDTADDDVAAPWLPEAAFADTLRRWPEPLSPTDAATNGTVADPAPDTPHVAEDAPEPNGDDGLDLTAVPTQIIGAAPAADVPQIPAYSSWYATPPLDPLPPATTLPDETTPQLVLDEDIVAHIPATIMPSPDDAATDAPTPTQDVTEPAATTPPPDETFDAAIMPIAETEQVIVAHSDFLSSEPPPVEQPKVSKTPSRPLGSGLLDKLRTILHTPGQMPALATGTVVVPRHMYPQHTYSILARLQCRPATITPPAGAGTASKKEATFIVVEVEAAADAFYVPVRRLALRLPHEGGLSEGTFTITALRPSASNETDPITFTFRSVDNQLLHEGQFLADISILAPQQLASGNPMVTLVHALDIEHVLS